VRIVRGLRQCEVEGVVEQVFLFEFGRPRVGVAGVCLGEDEVEVAGLQGGQGPFRLHLRDVDPQVRVPITQEVERGGNQGQGGRLERGDAKGAGQVRQGGGDVRLRALQAFENRFRVGDEDLGLLGQPHPSPDRFQQPNAHFGLQLRELLGNGGRGVGQGGGDGRQSAAVLEFAQQAQSVQVEHRQTALLADAERWLNGRFL
jgi:hypothetical protein